MKIIINADDFGRNPSITKAIVHAFGQGWITNTTIMANMPSFDEAIEQSKQAGFFDKVGLHLNLTQGTPLTRNIRKNTFFCNAEGDFTGNIWGGAKTQFWLDRATQACLREEIEAQIQKYLAAGFPQKHLDSHHHVHTIYSVFTVLKPLLKEYSIKSVRLSANLHPVNLYKKVYKTILNQRIRSSVPYTTDYFDSFEFTQNLPAEKDGDFCAELMCHPDYEGDKLINVKCMGFETLFALLDDKAELISYT